MVTLNVLVVGLELQFTVAVAIAVGHSRRKPIRASTGEAW